MRERLPDERPGFTHRFAINAKHPNKDEIVKYKGYVTVGLYSDGRVGELFVKMDKQGSQTSGWADCWAVAVSTLLQSGTSLESICRKFKGVKFEPRGMTDSEDHDLRFVGSPVDYIVRWLEKRFPVQPETVFQTNDPDKPAELPPAQTKGSDK